LGFLYVLMNSYSYIHVLPRLTASRAQLMQFMRIVAAGLTLPCKLDLGSGNRWFTDLVECVDAHMRPADQAGQPIAAIEEIEDHHL